MGKSGKQTEAANLIHQLLTQRGLDIPSRNLNLEESRLWVVWENRGRQVGIDSGSAIWVREGDLHNWRCIAMPCSVSGALQAVEFLTQG